MESIGAKVGSFVGINVYRSLGENINRNTTACIRMNVWDKIGRISENIHGSFKLNIANDKYFR